MDEKEISQYISFLATNKNVAASTQNQALNAIVYLYKKVLQIELGDFGQMERAKRPERLPVVLSREEVALVLGAMSADVKGLMAKILYGCGLRLMECLRLRVKDIDFHMNQIIVRSGKGDKDRVTMLPESIKSQLKDQLKKVARYCTKKISMTLGMYIFHLPWQESIPMHQKNFIGSMSSRLIKFPKILGATEEGAV